jgi:Predicted ICC-like phosphoesterases
MNAPFLHILKNQHCWLSPDRCIYWEEEKTLIVSDLHFGKTGHFRKSGIAVPAQVFKEDLQRLVNQLQHFQPAALIAVGDLFHSAANKELDLFKKWRNDFNDLQFHLVEGNHDILSAAWYNEMNIKVHTGTLEIKPFAFCHDCETIDPKTSTYTFSGHLHPGVRINGSGRQSLQFPCFYFTKNYCVLPAFSRFTGLALIDAAENENVFAIVGNKIVQLQ